MDSGEGDLRSRFDQDEDDSDTHNRGAVRRQWGRVVSAPKQAGSQCTCQQTTAVWVLLSAVANRPVSLLVAIFLLQTLEHLHKQQRNYSLPEQVNPRGYPR